MRKNGVGLILSASTSSMMVRGYVPYGNLFKIYCLNACSGSMSARRRR